MDVEIVDAFAAGPFSGNPAGVVVLGGPAPEAWMQRVAAELNLPATAFPEPCGPGRWALRWFSPSRELQLCGHATLATAHVLRERGAAGPMVFESARGPLTADPDGDGIRLDLPAAPAEEVRVPEGFAQALGATPVFLGFHNGNHLAELESEETVRSLQPDFAAMARRGWAVIATARGRGEWDFVSRFFAPSYGDPEDSATGSAHCSLAPHWAPRIGRPELTGYQASRRGGYFRVRAAGNRVHLAGQAFTVFRGRLDPAAAAHSCGKSATSGAPPPIGREGLPRRAPPV